MRKGNAARCKAGCYAVIRTVIVLLSSVPGQDTVTVVLLPASPAAYSLPNRSTVHTLLSAEVNTTAEVSVYIGSTIAAVWKEAPAASVSTS